VIVMAGNSTFWNETHHEGELYWSRGKQPYGIYSHPNKQGE